MLECVYFMVNCAEFSLHAKYSLAALLMHSVLVIHFLDSAGRVPFLLVFNEQDFRDKELRVISMFWLAIRVLWGSKKEMVLNTDAAVSHLIGLRWVHVCWLLNSLAEADVPLWVWKYCQDWLLLTSFPIFILLQTSLWMSPWTSEFSFLGQMQETCSFSEHLCSCWMPACFPGFRLFCHFLFCK